MHGSCVLKIVDFHVGEGRTDRTSLPVQVSTSILVIILFCLPLGNGDCPVNFWGRITCPNTLRHFAPLHDAHKKIGNNIAVDPNIVKKNFCQRI